MTSRLWHPSRWWWAREPRVWLLLAFAFVSYSRMQAYLPSQHPEPLTWGLQLVASFLPVPVFAGIWALSAVLCLYLAFSRDWSPTAMFFTSLPPFLWGLAYSVSVWSPHSVPRDNATSQLYIAMGVAYLAAGLIPSESGWRRGKVSLVKEYRHG